MKHKKCDSQAGKPVHRYLQQCKSPLSGTWSHDRLGRIKIRSLFHETWSPAKMNDSSWLIEMITVVFNCCILITLHEYNLQVGLSRVKYVTVSGLVV